MFKNTHKHIMSHSRGYIDHTINAYVVGVLMIIAGAIAIIHGTFPMLFKGTAKRIINTTAANNKLRQK